MKFEELLIRAKLCDIDAQEKLFEMYRPMLIKASIISGRFDEDLFQEQSIVFLKSIEYFMVD